MTHTVAALAVTVAAIIAAVVVQVAAAGDAAPYVGLAGTALGYAAGNTVRSTRNGKL